MSDHYYTQSPRRKSIIVKSDRNDTAGTYHCDFDRMLACFPKQVSIIGSRVLIEALELDANANVLDVGCGYGPIGLQRRSLLQNGHVTMIDINERAVELARENAKLK